MRVMGGRLGSCFFYRLEFEASPVPGNFGLHMTARLNALAA